METTADKIVSKASEYIEPLEQHIEPLKKNIHDVDQKIRRFVRNNPGTTLLCALALGYGIGRLIARR